MSDKITNEAIYNKLLTIERMLKTIKQEEDTIIEEEKEIEKEEKLLHKEEKKIEQKVRQSSKGIKYDNILDWKTNIWEGCIYKKEILKESEIDYWCKKQNAPCRFTGCPINTR